MSKDTLVKGAFILTLAGVIVKVIGALNRLLLFRFLGGEGIGLYQLAYPIYLLALSVSSAGIPVAISILVSEKMALHDYIGAKRVFRYSVFVLVILGLLFTGLLWVGAQWLIDWQLIRDRRAYYAIMALVPAIFFVTIQSSFRGYFQGLRMMVPSAASQIVEQLVRVVTMVALAYYLFPWGIEYAAAGATFGATPGAVFGLLILLYYYYRQKNSFHMLMSQQTVASQESGKSIVYRIAHLAIPVSLANVMVPIVDNIDVIIVPARLEAAGYLTNQATEFLGYLGMAIALINLPTILTAALSTSLVPAISEAHTLHNQEAIIARTGKAMRLTVLICLPSFAGMCLLAVPISQVFCGNSNAAPSIAILAFGVIFLGVQQTTTGILQGLGRTGISTRNLIFSSGIKIVLNYTLTAIPGLGIMGAAWATVADFAVAAMLNLYWLKKITGFVLETRQFLRTAFAVAVMGIGVVCTYHYGMWLTASDILSMMVAIIFGALMYCLALVGVGGVQHEDLNMVPVIGAKLANCLHKYGLSHK